MTFEFKATVSPSGQINVPADIAGQITAGTELHVVLTCEAAGESDALLLDRKLREKSYSAAVGETVYDSLA